MLQYWHRNETLPPRWLRGCGNCSTRQMREGRTFGAGEGHYLTAPPESASELEGGWRCWTNQDGPQPEFLVRRTQWLYCQPAIDMADHEWQAPIVLDHNGRRAFKVAYDQDWKPFLTDQQKNLINWAEEATIYLSRMQESGRIEDPAPGCAWAAKFLEMGNHITSEIIGKRALMDDQLMLTTLRIATGVMQVDHA